MCVYYRYVEGVVHRLEKEIRNIINQESDPDKETPAEREKVFALLALLVQKRARFTCFTRTNSTNINTDSCGARKARETTARDALHLEGWRQRGPRKG